MQNAIIIGPLMLAVDRGVAVLCIAAFIGLAALAERQGVTRVSAAGSVAVLAGLAAARIGYVVVHWSSYADEPLSTLAVRQGGFLAKAGLAGATLALVLRLGRTRALIVAGVPLAISSGLWFTLTALMPAVAHGPFPYGLNEAEEYGSGAPERPLNGSDAA